MNEIGKGSIWRACFALYKKDVRVFFLSPMAGVFFAAMLVLSGAFFYLGVGLTGEASLRSMVANLGVAMLFGLPLVTMRSLADEERMGTLELLLTTPIPLPVLVLAKWLAAFTLSAMMLLLISLYAAVLVWFGEPDLGVLLTTFLGLLLVSGAFCAAGLFASSLTADPTVAAVGGVLVLLPFWLATTASSIFPEWAILNQFGFIEHLRGFAIGVVDSADVSWFIGFTGLFLFLTWRSLESRRWR